MSKLKNKVAIVTGASKGIGAGIAKAYGAEGASVVVNYASDKEGADRVVTEITKSGGKAIAVQGSVAVAADVKRIFRETKEVYGQVDILVNNAGVFKFEPVETITEEEFHRQFNINVLGTLLATQQAVNDFGTNGGSIINVSSVISDNPSAHSVVYSATKGAVDTIAVALSKELGSRKIRVNTIAPGATLTERTTNDADYEATWSRITPMGRPANTRDIANAALFLVSDRAKHITGQSLIIDGGWTAVSPSPF